MNRKGFTLIELLACFALLGVILGIGLLSARGTLATTLSTITDVSRNEIYNASKTYVLENGVNWTNDSEEYTCITVRNLVEKGYFEEDEVRTYINDKIRLVRNQTTKVIDSVSLVDVCE